MKYLTQAGFSVIEAVVVVVVLAVIGGAGLMLIKRSSGSDPKPVVTSTSVPVAPAVDNTSDLTKAQQTLDQTDVDAATTDSTQFDAQLNGF